MTDAEPLGVIYSISRADRPRLGVSYLSVGSFPNRSNNYSQFIILGFQKLYTYIYRTLYIYIPFMKPICSTANIFYSLYRSSLG